MIENSLPILLLILPIGLILRNEMVFRYRKEMLDKVSRASSVDILRGRDFWWRYDVLRKPSYPEMVYKFWRRLDSFYPDKDFVETTQLPRKS